MKKNWKRLGAFLLTLAMLLSLTPLTALAAGTGDETPETPLGDEAFAEAPDAEQDVPAELTVADDWVPSAEDASMDYPLDASMVSASSWSNSGSDGPASYAIDGNSSHWWHWWYNNCGNSEGITANADGTNAWFQFSLPAATPIIAIRYRARTSGNRDVHQIQGWTIQTSDDGSTWTDAKSGSFGAYTSGSPWLLAQLDSPVTTQYVRFCSTSSTVTMPTATDMFLVMDKSVAINRPISGTITTDGTTPLANAKVELVDMSTATDSFDLGYENNTTHGKQPTNKTYNPYSILSGISTTTDENGAYTLTTSPTTAGTYRLRVSKPGHGAVIGDTDITIAKGLTDEHTGVNAQLPSLTVNDDDLKNRLGYNIQMFDFETAEAQPGISNDSTNANKGTSDYVTDGDNTVLQLSVTNRDRTINLFKLADTPLKNGEVEFDVTRNGGNDCRFGLGLRVGADKQDGESDFDRWIYVGQLNKKGHGAAWGYEYWNAASANNHGQTSYWTEDIPGPSFKNGETRHIKVKIEDSSISLWVDGITVLDNLTLGASHIGPWSPNLDMTHPTAAGDAGFLYGDGGDGTAVNGAATFKIDNLRVVRYDPAFVVTVGTVAGGTLTAKRQHEEALEALPADNRIPEGDTIVVTGTPDSLDHELSSVTVTNTDDESVTVTVEKQDDGFHFTMPAHPVTITGAFTPIILPATAYYCDEVAGTYMMKWTHDAGATYKILNGDTELPSSGEGITAVIDNGTATITGATGSDIALKVAQTKDGVTIYSQEFTADNSTVLHSLSRVDDTSALITYGGPIASKGNATDDQCLGGTKHWSAQADTGSSIDFTFYGTGIQVIGITSNANDWCENAPVTIDGTSAGAANFTNDSAAHIWDSVVYTNPTPLTLGLHTFHLEADHKIEFDGFTVIGATQSAVTLGTDEHGTLTAAVDSADITSGTTKVRDGSTVTLTSAATAANYSAGTPTVVKTDDTSTTVTVNAADNTFTMPAFPVTVTPVFTLNTYTVTFAGDNFTVEEPKIGENVATVTDKVISAVPGGSTVTFKLAPVGDYYITGVTYAVNGGEATALTANESGVYTLSNLSGNVTVTVAATAKTQETFTDVTINYADETLVFTENGTYTVTVDDAATTVTVTDGAKTQAIAADWMGKSASIVKAAGDATKLGSDAQTLAIDARPTLTDADAYSVSYTTEQVTVQAGYGYVIKNADEATDYTACTANGAGTAEAFGPGSYLYVYKKAVNTGDSKAFRSDVKKVAAPTRAADPTQVSINYTDETLGTTAALQYKLSGGEWTTCGADMAATAFGWNGNAPVAVNFRTAATGSAYASAGTYTLTIPVRPDAPALTLDTANQGVTIANTYSYNTTGPEYTQQTWTPGEGTLVNVAAGSSIYIYANATTGAFRSKVQTITVPAQPIAPTVNIDYEHETLGTTAALQYKLSGGEWTTCGADMAATDFGWDGTAPVTVIFRTAATDDNYAGAETEVTIEARPNAPALTNAANTQQPGSTGGSDGAITGVDNTMEYKMDASAPNWTPVGESETTIGNLSANTKVIIRLKATVSDFASNSVTLTVPQHTAEGQTPAPQFIDSTYTMASRDATTATFTLTAAPTDPTAYKLYANENGSDEAAGVTLNVTGTTVTLTFASAPTENVEYYITAETTDVHTESNRSVLHVQAFKSGDATLSALSLGEGVTLSPEFASGATSYTATVENDVATVTVTATATDDGHANVALTVGGAAGTLGTAANLNAADSDAPVDTAIVVTVTAEDGTEKVYTVTVTRKGTLAAAKAAVEGAAYTVDQASCNTAEAAKAKVESIVNALPALSGVTAVVTQTGFTAAQAGAEGTPSGTNGSYKFKVALTKADCTDAETRELTLTITATAYVAPDTYTVTTGTYTNGTVTANPTSGIEGATVTLTVTPDQYYKVNTLSYTKEDSTVVNITKDGNGAYTFPMPAGNVTVNATFKIDVEACKTDVETALSALTDQAQADCSTEAAAKAVVTGAIAALDLPGDVTVEISGVFTEAQAGTAENENGVNGNYVFTVTLVHGDDRATAQQSFAIIAAPYAGGDTPAVNKDALTAAIAGANAAKEGIQISASAPADVDKGTKFVTQDVMDALDAAIAAAQAVADNGAADQAAVDAAKDALDAAVADFTAAVQTGTKEHRRVPTLPAATTTVSQDGDGNVTTTVKNNLTGTVTETTEKADGTVEIVETKKDGTVTKTVTDPEGATVEKVITAEKDVSITVTDPQGEVLAKVELPAQIPAPQTRFEDVPQGHWADQAIQDVAGLGLVNGVGSNMYDMDAPMTRGGIASVLHRLSHGDTDHALTFTDVEPGEYYYEGVAWAANANVVKGLSKDEFAPDQVITREQIAVMLTRYAELIGMTVTADAKALNAFSDGGKTGAWAVDGVAWCVENGILKGKGGSILDPTAEVSRAEVAVILDRFIALMR